MKFLFQVEAVVRTHQLKKFLLLTLHKDPNDASITWLVPLDRVRIYGNYIILEELNGLYKVKVNKLVKLEWVSKSGFSFFTWRRVYNEYGLLEGVLSERSLHYLKQVVPRKFIVKSVKVVDLRELKGNFEYKFVYHVIATLPFWKLHKLVNFIARVRDDEFMHLPKDSKISGDYSVVESKKRLVIYPKRVEEIEFNNGTVKISWRHIYNGVGYFEGTLPEDVMHFFRRLVKCYRAKREVILQ